MPDAEDPLTVYADYVCPFCYLGRRSLERYEDERGEPVAIEWHPFDLRSHQRGPDGTLDPDRTAGKDEAYYDRARENVRRLQERYDVEMVQDLATDVDSLPAQRVSYHVAATHPDRWRDFDEAVYDALWVDGRDIEDADVLVDLATDVGLDPGVVETALEDDEWRERLAGRFEAAHQRGITGVPTFVYDGHVARGAVPPDQLRRLVEGAGGE